MFMKMSFIRLKMNFEYSAYSAGINIGFTLSIVSWYAFYFKTKREDTPTRQRHVLNLQNDFQISFNFFEGHSIADTKALKLLLGWAALYIEEAFRKAIARLGVKLVRCKREDYPEIYVHIGRSTIKLDYGDDLSIKSNQKIERKSNF
uniref:Uncharacterized protein n=1 Tax=Glossina pallidipes TaxID=7398 RepID=A0A1A9ZTI5_GLOPL